ncbi:PARP catalytic domain-containing protein [Mycena venus]|uniref:PARP catalytic domain-containing protein n=1 Tax=Mycena venus TaxID=2733690 RepID=A0A8H6XAC7_9AGAR|nr:PARP catalytic domain-containing protein [Mycena venus]
MPPIYETRAVFRFQKVFPAPLSSFMASHIPLALSLLQSFATQYPGGKQLWTPPSVATPAAAPAAPTAPAAPAAPAATASQSPPAAPSVPIPVPPPNPQRTSTASSAAVASISPPASTTASTSNLCENCQLRPKFSDGNKTHPYCSKSCANQAKLPSQPPSLSTSIPKSANCDFCGVRPKFFDGKRTHPFCSKACSKNATAQNPLLKPNAKGGTCHAPGCQKPAHTNANGTSGSYCCLAHKTLGETICLMCKQAPKQPQSHFCGAACADDAEKNGPMILEIPAGHVTFKSVADQFKVFSLLVNKLVLTTVQASWRHTGKNCPPVRRVYKIVATQATQASYKAYQTAVESAGHFVASGRSPGNENRRWHGTRRECNLGDKGHTQFCASTKCSLCCIIKSSFDISLWGTKTGWGRFGKGIYTSSTSSKSNDYSHNDCSSSFKAILLNKVIVGKGCKLTHDSVSLTAPPAGYDSVLAEKGGSLNYDELVVYTNDAIRPSFLVIYEP